MSAHAYSGPDPLQTLPEVGQRLRFLRKAAGKTQTEVATAAGMRQEALSRFESGSATDFSLAKLLRLLQVLELQLDFQAVVRRPTLNEVLHEVREGRNTGPDAQ